MSGNTEELDLLKELGKILDDIHEFADTNIAKPVTKFTDDNIKTIKRQLKYTFIANS